MATVGERFQVVIERDVRERLGIRPGDRAVETVEEGRLVVTFLPPTHRDSLLGLLPRSDIDDLEATRDRMADMLADEDVDRGSG